MKEAAMAADGCCQLWPAFGWRRLKLFEGTGLGPVARGIDWAARRSGKTKHGRNQTVYNEAWLHLLGNWGRDFMMIYHDLGQCKVSLSINGLDLTRNDVIKF